VVLAFTDTIKDKPFIRFFFCFEIGQGERAGFVFFKRTGNTRAFPVMFDSIFTENCLDLLVTLLAKY